MAFGPNVEPIYRTRSSSQHLAMQISWNADSCEASFFLDNSCEALIPPSNDA